MKKFTEKRIQGFSSFISLFVVAFLIVSGFAVYNQSRNSSTVPKNVLGESENKSENLITSTQTKEAPERKETPESVETPESKETPEPAEFEKEQEVEVKEGTNESKMKIRSGKNKFEFQQEGSKFSVESSFPLSVNPVTRELTVTTPAGSKVVAVLPQQAIDNMLTKGIVTSTSGVKIKTESDGSLSYKIDGTKNEKLLGVFDVAIPKNLVVSAQTGQVLVVNQSTFSKILDFLSI
jgi:hypothetical protein